MTLILLHGFLGSADEFVPLCERFHERVGDTIAIDLLGHGNAAKPADVGDCVMSAVVDDVVAKIVELVPDGPIDLFGYSMGGRVALSLALEHPAMVRRLAVLGASPGYDDPAERQERQVADNLLADRLEQEGIEAFVDHWLGLPMFSALHDLGLEWMTSYRNRRLAADVVGIAHSLRAAGAGAMPPLHQRLVQLTMPTLFLAGANDQKFSRLGAFMAQQVGDGSFVSVRGAGHAAHLEAPELVVGAVSHFLQS